MACDPRCISWFSDDPTVHDCRDTQGRTRRHTPHDPVAEGRRHNAAHRARTARPSRNGTPR